MVVISVVAMVSIRELLLEVMTLADGHMHLETGSGVCQYLYRSKAEAATYAFIF